MDAIMDVGKKLRDLRNKDKTDNAPDKIGITQAALAQIAQVSTNSIISYEKGKSYPPLDVAARIARHFRISLDDLCGLSNEKTCAQLAHSLIRLNEATNFELCNPHPDNPARKTAIQFGDDPTSVAITKFLSGWKPLNEIYTNGFIEEENYQTLVSDAMEKFPDGTVKKESAQ